MNSIEMTIPGGVEHIRPARLVAASVASDLGFDMEGLEDIRIAIDELCSLLATSVDDRVHLVFSSPRFDQLEVTGRCEGTADVLNADWLVREILESTVDELELPTPESPSFRFVRGRAR